MLHSTPLIGAIPGIIEGFVSGMVLHLWHCWKYGDIAPLWLVVIVVVGFCFACILVISALMTLGIV